ncbi:unnamed protein product [Diplocarpon coronariae]
MVGEPQILPGPGSRISRTGVGRRIGVMRVGAGERGSGNVGRNPQDFRFALEARVTSPRAPRTPPSEGRAKDPCGAHTPAPPSAAGVELAAESGDLSLCPAMDHNPMHLIHPPATRVHSPTSRSSWASGQIPQCRAGLSRVEGRKEASRITLLLYTVLADRGGPGQGDDHGGVGAGVCQSAVAAAAGAGRKETRRTSGRSNILRPGRDQFVSHHIASRRITSSVSHGAHHQRSAALPTSQCRREETRMPLFACERCGLFSLTTVSQPGRSVPFLEPPELLRWQGSGAIGVLTRAKLGRECCFGGWELAMGNGCLVVSYLPTLPYAVTV